MECYEYFSIFGEPYSSKDKRLPTTTILVHVHVQPFPGFFCKAKFKESNCAIINVVYLFKCKFIQNILV
jgi:hypothetical protein